MFHIPHSIYILDPCDLCIHCVLVCDLERLDTLVFCHSFFQAPIEPRTGSKQGNKCSFSSLNKLKTFRSYFKHVR